MLAAELLQEAGLVLEGPVDLSPVVFVVGQRGIDLRRVPLAMPVLALVPEPAALVEPVLRTQWRSRWHAAR